MIVPLILMLIGEPAEMKMSEAFFSAISCRSFSMNMLCALFTAPNPLPRGVNLEQLVDACFARVSASTCLMMTRIETIPPVGAGQVAGHHHRARRNPPARHLAVARLKILVLWPM
jgi:hypothetical protein